MAFCLGQSHFSILAEGRILAGNGPRQEPACKPLSERSWPFIAWEIAAAGAWQASYRQQF